MGKLSRIAKALRAELDPYPGGLEHLVEELERRTSGLAPRLLPAVVLDPDGAIVHLSAGFGELAGVDPSEPVGQSWFARFVPEDEREAIRRVYQTFLETGSPHHFRNRLPVGDDMKLIAWENLRIRGPQGAVLGCLCLAEDVTDREALADALAESEAMYRGIFELVLEGLIIIETTGDIQSLNRTAERMFGYERGELVGRNVRELMPEPDRGRHDGYLQRYLETGDARIIGVGRDVVGQRKDGSIFPMRLGVSDVRIGDRRYFAGAVHDLTQQRQAEAELRGANQRLTDVNRQLVEEQSKLIHAEKLSSIGLLAAGVAHEINNPLMGIIGCVKALETERVPEGGREEYFETVRDGLERIRVIVAGLLDYARQRPPRPLAQDPGDVVRASLRLLVPVTRAKDVQVTHRIPAGAPCVRADRSQLMQAVVNLIVNSVHAVERGGRIEIDAVERDGRVGIRIRDDGPGIPAEHLNRVCDPFFTTKRDGEGTGLGLSVTLGIARAHGGDLEVESEPGAGASVTIWLPRGETPPAPGAPAP